MADGQLKDTRRDTVLDVTEERIARTYAQGFLGALGGDGAEAVAQLVELDREVFAKQPRLLEALGSAFLDRDKRLAMLDRLLGGRVDPTVLKLLKVLSDHGRIGIVRSVARESQKLFNTSKNRADVLVRLAQPADERLLKEIERTVREKTGCEPMMRVEVDPELVAGMEIRVGDTLFDGSLRSVFDRTRKAMINKTIHAIETNPERFGASA